MARTTIALMFAVLFVLVFALLLYFPAAINAAQVNPTAQQATVNAMVNGLFTQTAQAQHQLQATQTAVAALQRRMTATAVPLTATAGMLSTVEAGFSAAQTATAAATTTMVKPAKPTQASAAYEITLRIDELRCLNAQEDRFYDVAPYGDEIELIYSLTEKGAPPDESAYRWVAPIGSVDAVGAGDTFTVFNELSLTLSAEQDIQVSLLLREIDRLDESDNLGSTSVVYTAATLQKLLSRGTDHIQETKTFEYNEIANYYHYIITYTIVVKPIQ